MNATRTILASIAILATSSLTASAQSWFPFAPQDARDTRIQTASLGAPDYFGDEYAAPQREYARSTRALVPDPTRQGAGVITIDTRARALYYSLGNGQAIRYGVGVGREGFLWRGSAQVGRKAAWPSWTPPAAMLKRRPDLPRFMEGGIDNPLGARALSLPGQEGHALPHPWHQRAVDHRTGGLVGLHPHAQRRRDGSLPARSRRRARGGAVAFSA